MTALEPNPRLPLLSAVLISWNRKELLEQAINSLLDQHYPQLEIIVVDNGSTDGSVEWLRAQTQVRLIENTRNVGASAARNQGTRFAGGEYVIYMDSDAELKTGGALARWVERLEREQEIGGVAGIYYSDEALTRLWCWSPCMDWEGNHDLPASLTPRENPTVLTTCLAMFRLGLVREVGGFDEYFFYLYEDGDLCERIRKRGYRLVVDDEVKILHRVAERGRMKLEQIEYHYYHEKLRMYYVIKNWGLKRFLWSWWHKIKNPKNYLSGYKYLPFWCYIDIYVVRVMGLLLMFPWIRRRRNKRWV